MTLWKLPTILEEFIEYISYFDKFVLLVIEQRLACLDCLALLECSCFRLLASLLENYDQNNMNSTDFYCFK